MQGYLIINCIIGGQTLASASSRLDDTTGIVITGLISLAVCFYDLLPRNINRLLTYHSFQVTFCGYQTLHWLVFGHHYMTVTLIARPVFQGMKCSPGFRTS